MALRKNINYKPTKNQMILLTLIWAVGVLLLVLATTDLFTKSIFSMSLPIQGLILGATGTIFKLYFNYRKKPLKIGNKEVT